MSSRVHDVVVVGGRVAGAATALALARAGLDVVLLERARPGTDTLSTHALLRAGVRQLHRWGVLPSIAASGTPAVRRTAFHYPDIDPVIADLRPVAGVDALYAPRRYLLDGLLVAAAAHAGADVRHGQDVTELVVDGGRVTAVRAVGAGGIRRTLQARWVVGADGIASTVARAMAAPLLTVGRSGSALLYRYVSGAVGDAVAGGRSMPTYEWAYGHGAAAGLIPTNDALTCVFVATTPQRLRTFARSGREAAFRRVLAAASPVLAERVDAAAPATALRGWAGRHGFLRQAWGPGWALVGDAGYFKDPISAHGMTDALRDAELLAVAVLAAVHGEAESVAFARYQRERDLLSLPLLEAVDRIASYRWDGPQVRELLRASAVAAKAGLAALEALAGVETTGRGATARRGARTQAAATTAG